jgi:hypothetical protein
VPLIGILRFSHKQGGEAIVARSQGVLESTYEPYRFLMVGTIPPWSSLDFSEWRIENEEEDSAPGGRRRSGRRTEEIEDFGLRIGDFGFLNGEGAITGRDDAPRTSLIPLASAVGCIMLLL